MSNTQQTKLAEYNKKKAEGLERLRQNAQSAFVRAHVEKATDNIQSAIDWMDRAHRLAKHNPNITFDLVVLYLKSNQHQLAIELLIPLMRKFDFFEGWLVLAILSARLNQRSTAIEKLHYALSCNCPSLQSWGIINDIVKHSEEVGCCGLIGSTGQLWLNCHSKKNVSIYLNSELIGETNALIFMLPEGWENGSHLYVEMNGKPLVGSPIDLEAILRTEGFVESDKDFVKGWIWFPAEPDRTPNVTVIDANSDLLIQLTATEEFEVATLEYPLFRAKQFSIPIDKFKIGSHTLINEYGQQLIGSPIDPLLLIKKTKHLRNTEKQNPSHLSVSAYYKGNDPHTSKLTPNPHGVAIIVPVYKGLQETINCIELVRVTLPDNAIVQIVNDCSPDGELVEWLEDQVNHETIFLIHHLENMGFPSAVNTGISAWPDSDVILLNSDTLVAEGWIQKLEKAAYSADDIGTATPFSNDASIYSYPNADKENPIPTPFEVKNFNQYMSHVLKDSIIDIPTAHGFCMFIRNDCLAQTGLFQEILFAQGYGEENDFCIRAQHLGWRHVLAAGVFVGHIGGVSFQNSRNDLLKRNLKILNQLYPDYDQMIFDYIDENLLKNTRRRLDLYRLEIAQKTAIHKGISIKYGIFITHSYGGGVERAVQEQANELRLKNVIPIFIRPTFLGNGCRLEIQFKSDTAQKSQLEYLFPNLVFDLPTEYEDLLTFLRAKDIVAFQVHHYAGHHPKIRSLLKDLNLNYEMFLHDYMSFCPRISLITTKQVYCKEPSITECQKCIGTDLFDEETPIDMNDWLKRSFDELKAAQYIIVPSDDTANRIFRHFPKLKHIQIKNLEDDRPDLTLTQLSSFYQSQSKNQNTVTGNPAIRYRICIIGAIGIEKGFNVIQNLIEDAEVRALPIEFVIVGRTANDQVLENTDRVFITGSYSEEESVSLVMRQKADIAFFPSIWPETWCYALSIAWRAGLQTVAYDMGAISQRIKNTQRGWNLSLDMTISEQNNMLLNLCEKLRFIKSN